LAGLNATNPPRPECSDAGTNLLVNPMHLTRLREPKTKLQIASARCWQVLDLGTRFPAGVRCMQQPALTKTRQRRLEELAREAGRTPQSMLRFVLRDGFELCEEDVAAARAAEAEATQSRTVPHRQVLNEARAVIARIARARRRQAA